MNYKNEIVAIQGLKPSDCENTNIWNDETINKNNVRSNIKVNDTFTDGYEAVYNTKLEAGEKPLSRVIGHAKQKEELLSVIDWFKNSKSLKEKGISIPKGVILFGDPGNGKSLMIKEIINCVDAPVFIFQGEQENVVGGIINVFKKAREAGHAIIVFDELDLLINKDKRVTRALQENLDGVESSDDILVLAATNDIDEIPAALMRNGRLEKIIHIPYPTGEEAVELLKKHFKEFNVELPKNLDEEELAISFSCVSCAGVKAVVNDIILRNGFNNITTAMIDASIFNITDKIKSAAEQDNLDVAIHEAAHAVIASKYPQYFQLNRLNIRGASGEFNVKEVEKDYWPYDKAIADIKIALAGNLAQKIIVGYGSRGCESDLEHARKVAYNLFNKCGYSSCWETLPTIRSDTRTETYIKRRKMEVKIERLLKKNEKEVKKTIKHERGKISALGTLLFQKKHLKNSEILTVIS